MPDRAQSPSSSEMIISPDIYQLELENNLAQLTAALNKKGDLSDSSAFWYSTILSESDRQLIRQKYIDTLLLAKHDEQLGELSRLNQSDPQTIKIISNFKLHHDRLIAHGSDEIIKDNADIETMLLVVVPKIPTLSMSTWRLNLLRLQEAINTKQAMPVFGPPAVKTVPVADNSKVETWSDRLLLSIGIVGIAIAAVTSVVGALIYAAIKTVKSFKNIYNGEKVARSLFRLGAIGAASVSGAYGGMVVGAMIGSIVPVVGTVIGTVVGGVIGCFLSAGIAAFVAKKVAQFVSWSAVKLGYYGKQKIINPSSPDKYRLTAIQENRLTVLNHGVSNTPQILAMMEAVKLAKPGFEVFPDKETRAINNDFNGLLKAAKKDPTVANLGVYVGNKYLFRWSSDRWECASLQPKSEQAQPRAIRSR
jgi:hypothetical protein